ncbi:nuclear transport factor 2 family protein [Dyadobacter sp. NIV53]|uniref:nuclear transport factor 2 family protein n=1 Tax=Dyadobacter sp. NIV53 TaxID=2861765 RepID=UPI00286DF2DF|nr:nuclear transport factor 2 family protein [Dyadobacter sp. NIV53]
MKEITNLKWLTRNLVVFIVGLALILSKPESVSAQTQNANTSDAERQIATLSKDKWRWMSEKNIDSLAALFDDKAVFVHMGGSWGKDRELDVIKGGGIWYKKAEVYTVSVNIFNNTAILLNDIDLLAVVGGNEPGRRSGYSCLYGH